MRLLSSFRAFETEKSDTETNSCSGFAELQLRLILYDIYIVYFEGASL